MDCSMPGFPVLHSLPKFAQTHVHWVGGAIQPSCPLLPPSPALNLSQHQGLFQWVGSLHHVAKVLEYRETGMSAAKLLQSCPVLCNPMNCSLPGSSVHGILQARVLEWLPCPPLGDLSDLGIESCLMCPALAGEFFTTSSTWEACWET